jgi:nitroimidazol reductase NimA-like FMN-containing flavoprotein (pyridoxamine 5'-phosphate oxidase superfamily)
MHGLEAAVKLFQGELVPVPRPDCLRLLAISRVGRVAYNHPEGPVVVPVNGRVVGTSVFLRTRAGSALAAALRDAAVSYQVDGFDDFHQAGWSILLRGRSRWVDEDELPEYESDWPLPWAAGERDLYVRIDATDISGRRLKA